MHRLIASVLGLVAFVALASGARAQTADELRNDMASPGNVLTTGMGYGQQRFSPLDKINKENVKNLAPVWAYSLADTRGQEAQPLVYDGIMYITTHDTTHAIDTKTGKQVWKHKIEYPPETPRVACCGIVNRGAALYNGTLFRTTLDANVLALDAKTGEEKWKENAADFSKGYSMTVAPLIADGVLITGISGGEFGTRGFIDGWDPETGKKLWRTYTTAAPDQKGGDTWPGDTYKNGGAPTWLTGSYDPKLNLVYWGTGNGGPWNAEYRKGDNLYICSVLALDPKTGDIKWHFQYSPNDPYDYDGVNENVLATVQVDGKDRDVMMHADRNGFFYVIDRTNGELISANKFVKNLTWAEKIDLKTGRPVESKVSETIRSGKESPVWPSPLGGKNWMPMAYNPGTGLAYANTLELGGFFSPVEPKYQKGAWYVGYDMAKLGFLFPDEGKHSYLRAIDPLTGKAKWEVGNDVANFAGVMTTGGGLVFTGALTGEFRAYDADTGDKLWEFQTGSGIIGQPITWEADGKQYVSIASGMGGVYAIFMPLAGAANKELVSTLSRVQPGGSVWTFALSGN